MIFLFIAIVFLLATIVCWGCSIYCFSKLVNEAFVETYVNNKRAYFVENDAENKILSWDTNSIKRNKQRYDYLIQSQDGKVFLNGIQIQSWQYHNNQFQWFDNCGILNIGTDGNNILVVEYR